MDRLEVYERRAWRLAILLTGDRAAARAVVQRSLDRQADVTSLPPVRLDRLVVQAARQGGRLGAGARPPLTKIVRSKFESVRAGHRLARSGFALSKTPVAAEETLDSPFSPAGAETMAALIALRPQQREAWIFRTLDSVDPIEASKALDCSRTALDRHLRLAHEAIERKLGERIDACVHALRRDVEALDPAPFIEGRRESRRRRRLWRRVRTIVVALTAIGVGIVLWLRFG